MPNGGIDYRDGTGVQDPPFLCEELEFYGQGFSPESMGAQVRLPNYEWNTLVFGSCSNVVLF